MWKSMEVDKLCVITKESAVVDQKEWWHCGGQVWLHG